MCLSVRRHSLPRCTGIWLRSILPDFRVLCNTRGGQSSMCNGRTEGAAPLPKGGHLLSTWLLLVRGRAACPS